MCTGGTAYHRVDVNGNDETARFENGADAGGNDARSGPDLDTEGRPQEVESLDLGLDGVKEEKGILGRLVDLLKVTLGQMRVVRGLD
jgi:hypothetical protein